MALVQLLAQGQQDVYITGKPDITFFMGKYSRHTPFVLEAFEIPFNGTEMNFNSKQISTLPYKGDLVRSITLQMELPFLHTAASRYYWPYGGTAVASNDITQLPQITLDGVTHTAGATSNNSYFYQDTDDAWYDSSIVVDFARSSFNFPNAKNTIQVSLLQAQFWGLDSRNGTIDLAAQTVTYQVVNHGTHSDFSFEQSGWKNGDGPSAIVNRQGLLFNLPPTPGGVIDLRRATSAGICAYANVNSTGGLYFSFGAAFVIKGILYGESIQSITVGSYTHTFELSTNPTFHFTIPLEVTSAGNYAFSFVGGPLTVGSYISLLTVDSIFTMDIPSYVNSTSVLKLEDWTKKGTNVINVLPSGDFKFYDTGAFLINAAFDSLPDEPINTLSVYENNVLQYTFSPPVVVRRYDMVVPVVVTNTNSIFELRVNSPGLSINVGSFVTVVQVASSNVLNLLSMPTGGLFFQPPPTSSYTPNATLDLTSWTAIGDQSNVTSNLTVVTPNYYMLYMSLNTTDIITSATFCGVTRTLPIGMNQPYALVIPSYAATDFQATISFTTFSGAPCNILSNSFIVISPFATNISYDFNYVDSVGTYVINDASLYIGGQLVETLSGEFIELWNDLHTPYENKSALTLLTGRQDTSGVYGPLGRTYLITLPFYFYRNPELLLPICALTKQDVQVSVTFKDFASLPANLFPKQIAQLKVNLTASLVVEYAYLGTKELEWMQKSRLDYMITQVQATNPINFQTSLSTVLAPIPFINPVRDLFIVIQNSGTGPYDYSVNGLVKAVLKFNGQEYFKHDAQHLGTVVPYFQYSTLLQRLFYVYSFATDPLSPKPTGQVNFSRLRDVEMEITLTPGLIGTRRLTIYGTSFNLLRIENGLGGLAFA